MKNNILHTFLLGLVNDGRDKTTKLGVDAELSVVH